MKTIQLLEPPQGIPQSPEEFLSLLLQAQEETLLLTLPDGRSFTLAFCPDVTIGPDTEDESEGDENEDDFEAELECQRNNPELMTLLDEQGALPQRTFSMDEVKARLGLM